MYPMYKIKLHDPSANDSLRPIELPPFESIVKFFPFFSRAIARPSIEKESANARANIRKRKTETRNRQGDERVLPSDPFRRAPSRRSGIENVAGPLFLFVLLFHFSFFFPSFPSFFLSFCQLLSSVVHASNPRKHAAAF